MAGLDNMVVFNDQLQTATVVKLEQMSDKFNAASGGALVLANSGNLGDFAQEAFWENVSSAIRDVDAYAANTTAAETEMTQSILNTVKTMTAFGPIVWENNQLTWINLDQARAIAVISESLAMAMMEDQLNKLLGGLVGALSNNAPSVNDISATAGLSQSALNNTHAKFGDSSQLLTVQIMTGSAYHKLIGIALDNQAQLFTSTNVTVIDILGKRTVITDAPSLIEAGAPNKTKVLCLVPGAGTIEPNGDFIANIHTPNGQTRLETTYQAEYTENVGLKGYSWDIASGGKSPLKTEIATGTNWDIAFPLKQTAGVILIADADL